jgi:hypothetical protein
MFSMQKNYCFAFTIIVGCCLFLLAIPSSPAAAPSPRTGAIIGKAVDAQDKGVEDVLVNVYGAKDETKSVGTATTGNDGRFTIKNIPKGDNYIVKAVKKKSILGVCGEKRKVSVETDKTSDVGNIQLKVPTKLKKPKT